MGRRQPTPHARPNRIVPRAWSGGTAAWVEGDTAYLSVAFTWGLPLAYARAAWYRSMGCQVRAGGPAVSLMPDYLAGVAETGGEVDALPRHNPNATITSRGCIRRCPFCAVPRIEGDLRELGTWPVRPIVCDNNLLACSRRHFDRVVDSLKPVRAVDFNQGLDARLLTAYHAQRLAELDCMVRLAWDDVRSESQVMDAIAALRAAGFPKHRIRCYVLLGYADTPDDARYRLESVAGMGIKPNPMRYNPLDALVRDQYVGEHWTDDLERQYMRYWANLRYTQAVPFDEWLEQEMGGSNGVGRTRLLGAAILPLQTDSNDA